MASLPCSCWRSVLLLSSLLIVMAQMAMAYLSDEIEVGWGQDHSFFYMDGPEDGQTLALCLDETHGGSGFHTKEAHLYGRFDIDIMLVPGNSAGTVTTLYLYPDDVAWEHHDEVDLEFLGNVTGEPYTLHTNIFVDGVGHRVQHFRLWFDPTICFHTYSIDWNPKRITILVDGVAIREFKNHVKDGVPFPTWQKMTLQGTLWNADDWATQGGRVKTDWSAAPFIANYRNLRVSGCRPSPGVAWCGDEPPESTWFDQGRDEAALQNARDTHMLYDYCQDTNRKDLPKECTLN